MRIGIIAGEASGDILAAGLMEALLEQYPDTQFEGVAGPLMIEAGCKELYPAEKLSVMGLVEILAHYKELSAMRKQLIRYFLNDPPDVFIGIDAPDFNLHIEYCLKQAGIKTIHYVSPSVWAWRQYRLGKIARSVDLMLTLFPFEARFYENHNIHVNYVGHTLADQIDLTIDLGESRKKLGLDVKEKQSIIAVLPGSRMSEVTRLAHPFIETLIECLYHQPDLVFTIPFVNQKTRQFFEQVLEQVLEKSTHTITDLRSHFILFDGQSRSVMAASDVVLLASGTAALEALLLKKPMVVAYKLSPITYWIAKRLLKVPYYSLPNLLAGEALVEEITQNDICADILAPKLLQLLSDKEGAGRLDVFNDIHLLLRKDANKSAAQAVINFLKDQQILN